MIDKLIQVGLYPFKVTINWDLVESFPAFQQLKNTPQSPVWHAEGSAWIHTKEVVYWAKYYAKDLGLNIPETKILVLAALFHDIGKSTATFTDENGKIHSYKHEHDSEKLTRRILWDSDVDLRERICTLVRFHMKMHQLKEKQHYNRFKDALNSIIEQVPDFYLLSLLALCDTKGAKYDPEAHTKDVEFMEEVCSFAYKSVRRKSDYRSLWFALREPVNVVILIGLSGSGKTTWLQNYVTKHRQSGDNYTILSRDLIRIELGYCTEDEKYLGTKEEEDKVTEIFNQRFKEALENKMEIYIDNMNLRSCYRDDYKKLAGKHNICWNYVYIQPSNINLNYERRPEISKAVFDGMIQKMDWPNPDEYDNLTILDYENA